MNITNEDNVTKILTDKEIIRRQDSPELFENTPHYSTNPLYDLTHFMNTKTPELSQFGNRYVFVK